MFQFIGSLALREVVTKVFSRLGLFSFWTFTDYRFLISCIPCLPPLVSQERMHGRHGFQILFSEMPLFYSHTWLLEFQSDYIISLFPLRVLNALLNFFRASIIAAKKSDSIQIHHQYVPPHAFPLESIRLCFLSLVFWNVMTVHFGHIFFCWCWVGSLQYRDICFSSESSSWISFFAKFISFHLLCLLFWKVCNSLILELLY